MKERATKMADRFVTHDRGAVVEEVLADPHPVTLALAVYQAIGEITKSLNYEQQQFMNLLEKASAEGRDGHA